MRLEDRETIRSLFSVKEGTLGPLLLPKEGTHTHTYSNYLATVPHMHSVTLTYTPLAVRDSSLARDASEKRFVAVAW